MIKLHKLDTIAAFLLAALIAIPFLFGSGGGLYAAAATDVVSNFEAQNVWDDLESASIDGESIDLTLFNFDKNKNVQIISFVEFCYSFSMGNQDDYGLYVYVYNPKDIQFSEKEGFNKIELRYSGKTTSNYEKYKLIYLNKSNKPGYEGLFYKFKIALTDEQRAEMLKSLNSSARVYEVIGIELAAFDDWAATEYKISNKYTYTGYAKGYGPSSASESTLSCSSDGLMSLTLDVHPAQYRPEGSSGGKTDEQDILYSVYFSIPNDILNEYGGLSAVHATWLNATTTGIFVTGNSDIYNSLNAWLWEHDGEANLNQYPEYSLLANAVVHETDIGILMGNNAGRYMSFSYDSAFNVAGILPDFQNGITTKDEDLYYGVNFSFSSFESAYLRYIFLAENGDADNYLLEGSKILEHIKNYTKTFGLGENPVAGKYNANLFDSYDTEFTDINIKATDNYTLTSETWGQSFWEMLFGGSHIVNTETFKNIKAIQPIKSSDFKSSVSETCRALYIEEYYYNDFKEFYDSATKRDETVFLFRYYQDKYKSQETLECQRLTINDKDCLKKIDTNAYTATMVVNLDFDIIDVTCTKGNVSTVIGVLSSPQDIVPNATPPLVTTPPDGESCGDVKWQAILAILGVIFILFIVFRFFQWLRG